VNRCDSSSGSGLVAGSGPVLEWSLVHSDQVCERTTIQWTWAILAGQVRVWVDLEVGTGFLEALQEWYQADA